MIERRKTRTVTVGNVTIGSEYPVSIQSMAKTGTSDVRDTIDQIQRLEKCGCELVRVAVKELDDAAAISSIKNEINIPLIADIHFDPKLAIRAIKHGADKIRINPGNITDKNDIASIIDAASEKNVPIRLGINSGSLMEMAAGKGQPADLMVASMLEYLKPFRERNFNDIVISLKASSVSTTVEAYRKMADECDYPFHVGVTAAGLPAVGLVKSSIGIGSLLLDGIGDTIRVSLTGDPLDEVDAAKRILSAAGVKRSRPEIISCPTCGRCQIDLVSIVKELEEELKQVSSDKRQAIEKQLVIAVMGCEVNGPGEAKVADIGIAFGKGKGAIFRRGVIIKTIDADDSVKELLKMIKEEI